MSQFFKSVNGVIPPGTAIVTVTGDDGVPVPPDAAGNLNLFGGETTANNLFGIRTVNTAANTESVQLTNRVQGFISTNDATPNNIITFPLGATPGVYSFQGSIEAFDTTDTAGGAYTFTAAVRTTGAAAIQIGTEIKDVFEEAAMSTADFDITVSGNNLIVQVTGIAATAIDWRALVTYRFVG
jgi:hypothetical protein